MILVTGGAGYIGSHAARALRRAGYEVLLYDNLCTGFRRLAEGFELIEADIADTTNLIPALSRVNAVMHFAAHASVGESVKDPREYFRNNVTSSLALLNAVVDAGIKLFVFSSTCAVYGNPERLPISERTPCQPVNPYGVSKLFLENALDAYGQAYGMRSARLRYFNAAGAGESGEIGELHNPETHLIPLVLRACCDAEPELKIYGSDYPTPDGTCIRDYIHVSDLADAHVRALQYLESGGESLIANLGTGRGHSVLEVIKEAEAITGCRVPRSVASRRSGDPPALVADPSHAQTVLQWTGQRDLSDMISSAWKWMQRSVAVDHTVPRRVN